jgi:hypothetical protein
MEGTRKEEQPIDIAQQRTQTAGAQICQLQICTKIFKVDPFSGLLEFPHLPSHRLNMKYLIMLK